MGAVHRKAGVSNPRSDYEPKEDSEQYINSFKQIVRNVESFSFLILSAGPHVHWEPFSKKTYHVTYDIKCRISNIYIIIIISLTSTFPRLIKGMDGCFPTALGRQTTLGNIMGPLV